MQVGGPFPSSSSMTAQLMAMGFDQQRARMVATVHPGSINDALSWLEENPLDDGPAAFATSRMQPRRERSDAASASSACWSETDGHAGGGQVRQALQAMGFEDRSCRAAEERHPSSIEDALRWIRHNLPSPNDSPLARRRTTCADVIPRRLHSSDPRAVVAVSHHATFAPAPVAPPGISEAAETHVWRLMWQRSRRLHNHSDLARHKKGIVVCSDSTEWHS